MLEIQRQRDEVERQVRASRTSPSAPAVPKNPPTQTTPSNIKTSAYDTGTPYRGLLYIMLIHFVARLKVGFINIPGLLGCCR